MQGGLKCRIDFPSAPLPLTVQNVGARGSYGRADAGIGPCNNKRKSSSTFVGGDAHIAPPFGWKAPSNFVEGGVPDAPL